MTTDPEILNTEVFVPVVEIKDPLIADKKVRLFVKREDLIHEHISGNKWRKLKFNFRKVKEEGHSGILTFGGAFSNHIAAAAYASKKAGIKSIGIIRGEENYAGNPTLKFAKDNGMDLHFISRSIYRQKNDSAFIESLHKEFGSFYLIPEGGANYEGMMGCMEIMDDLDESDYDLIFCACGTGTTLSGIINACTSTHTKVIGIPVVADENTIRENIENFTHHSRESIWSLNMDYHLGGYARRNRVLDVFIDDFTNLTNIPLDLIYTGKLFFAIYDMIRKDLVPPGSRILAIHTGGIQGNAGFSYLKNKKPGLANLESKT